MTSMSSPTRTRWALGAVGVLVGLYGAWLLVSREDRSGVLDALVWLVGGVVVHDGVLAPLVLVLAFAARGLPAAYRRACVLALVVVGSLTLLAIPVLGRFGARSDNDTLLDRPYLWSWVGLVVVAVAVVAVVGTRGTRRASGDRPGSARGPGSDTPS